ncbi:MAG: ATP-dependent helicase, partial [Eggerthellaceae bacterium]|nr:ATP-dependent helicase [Eggerthellaceae bacterium]
MKKTLKALRDNPELARSLRSRFKLVMVDEFQDTNQLQIDLIEQLCATNDANLCTVGDSQQSIYRFQGADVNVYIMHKEQMRSEQVGALCVELDQNFRSHQDILGFVRKVCGTPNYFQEEFLDLSASRDEQRLIDNGKAYKAQIPRIIIQQTFGDYMVIDGEKVKVEVDDLRRAEAQGIAGWFSRLRAAGHDPSEMVVLMGVTTGAEIYLDELRKSGFSAIMSGGSEFFKRTEVLKVSFLLRALANPSDTQALFSILSGDPLNISADDFLLLSTSMPKEGQPFAHRSSIGKTSFFEAPAESSERLRWSLEVLHCAWKSLGSKKPSEVVRKFIDDSGWFERLEKRGIEGESQAANILKSIRVIEELESQGAADIAGVARLFREHLDDKEKLGALIGDTAEAIRVMTVHGSKGREFPFVAVVNCFKA